MKRDSLFHAMSPLADYLMSLYIFVLVKKDISNVIYKDVDFYNLQ